REVAASALLALAANDGERHDDALALLQVAVHPGADLDDLAHHLVAHDVAGQHRRNEIVEEVEIRATDRAARHFDDGVAWVFDLGVCNRVEANVLLAMPNESFHWEH